MKSKNTDIAVVGFALFSMFFGAGNLLFPPYLGLISGTSWPMALAGFVLADVGLALLVITAAAKCSGNLDNVLIRGGKKLARVIGAASILCIGPLLAIPRTAATTYEMGIIPMLGDMGKIGAVAFSIIFFGITLALTIRPSKVVDIIGKFLTPVLLLVLAVLIIKGIMTPIGDINVDAMIDKSLLGEGISQGYLTMDALAAAALATVLVTSIAEKGYNKPQDQVKITIKAGILAGIALALVYGGLTYLGATLSKLYGIETPQASLMVVITSQLFGYPGKIVLCIIVALACLTTAIGLISATGEYFSKATNGKLKYEKIVIIACIFSAVISNFGVDTIIKFSGPILQVVYPGLMVLVVMSLGGNYIKNDNAFKGAVYVTLIVSVFSVADSLWHVAPFVNKLPLAKLGFNWVVPAIIGGLLGSLVKRKKINHEESCKVS